MLGLSPVTINMSLLKTIGCGPGIAQVLAASHFTWRRAVTGHCLSGPTPNTNGMGAFSRQRARVSSVSDKGLLRWACC